MIKAESNNQLYVVVKTTVLDERLYYRGRGITRDPEWVENRAYAASISKKEAEAIKQLWERHYNMKGVRYIAVEEATAELYDQT